MHFGVTEHPAQEWTIATDAGSVSLESGAEICAARSRCDLRSRLCRHDERDGHGESDKRAAIALAKSVCGADRRFRSSRMSGPRYGVERRTLRILSPIENASRLGEGFTRAASDLTVGNGTSRGAAAGGWAASSLRTTGGVSNPGIHIDSAGRNSRHCGECFPETEEFLSYRVLVALFQYDRIFGRDSQAFPVRAYMSVSEEETVPSDFFCQ